MALNSVERTNIIKLTVGLYNAAPGRSGLADFADFYEANGRSLNKLALNLGNNGIFKALYPSFQTASEFAKSILTPYGLQNNSDAIGFVVSRFNSPIAGIANKGSIAFEAVLAINNTTATTGDFANARAILNNKTVVAENYSTDKDGTATSIVELQRVVAGVTADASGLGGPINPIATDGFSKTYTLTSSQDTLMGTPRNDLFNATAGGSANGQSTQPSLSNSDTIDGAGGSNKLVIDMIGDSYNGTATIKNIQTLEIGTHLLTPVSFNYNPTQGTNNITDVSTIVASQVTAGESLSIVNIVQSAALPTVGAAGAANKVIPVINWINDSNTDLAGVVTAKYRPAELVGAADTQVLGLSHVNSGVFNLSGGFETIDLKGYSDQQVTLNNSANVDTGADGAPADLVSTGTLTKVVIGHATGSTAVIGKAAGIQAVTGLTDRVVGSDGNGVGTQSNLLSVGSRVTQVDASQAAADVNVRFVAKTDGTPTDVTFKGGAGNDYVEFESGNVSATGGAGSDTFAFINSTILNAGFSSGDSIAGGSGLDTIQLGLNGVGNFDVSTNDFGNKTGIDVLDLRGASNKVRLSDAIVTGADAGLTVRTNKIVQTSIGDLSNPAGGSNNENDSVSTIDITKLSGTGMLRFIGGSGSDRIIGNQQSFTSSATLNGGTNIGPSAGMAVAGDYDTLTVVDNAILNRDALSNIRGFEGLVLVKSASDSARQFTIEISEKFLLSNTLRSNDTTATSIDDRAFQIGTVAAASGNALSAGDTVTLDISDIFSAGVYNASLGTCGIDVSSLILAGVSVNYLLNGMPASAAQIAAVSLIDAAGGDVLASAGVQVIPTGMVFNVQGTTGADPGLSITAAADNVQALAGDDTITTTATALTLIGTINGGPGNDSLVLNAATASIAAATITGVETLSVSTGSTTTLTAAQYNGFTGYAGTAGVVDGGAGSVGTLSTPGVFSIAAHTATAGFDTLNLATGGNTVTLTGIAAAAQVINGGRGNDSFTSTSVNLALRTLNGGGGTDTLSVTDQLALTFGLTTNGIKVYNLIRGVAAAGVLTGSDGAGVVYNVAGVSVAAATGNVLLGTGGQTVNSTTTGSVAYKGGAGTDTFNLGAGAEAIIKSGSTFGVTGVFDTVSNFKASGADTFSGGGAAAISLNVLTIASSSAIGLAANIQTAAMAAGASLVTANQAYLVNVTSGTAMGQYAFQNIGSVVTAVDATDFIVRLVGTTGSIVAADFAA